MAKRPTKGMISVESFIFLFSYFPIFYLIFRHRPILFNEK